jgi:hypothetical protein
LISEQIASTTDNITTGNAKIGILWSERKLMKNVIKR